jgi:hypothetical protein
MRQSAAILHVVMHGSKLARLAGQGDILLLKEGKK